MKLSTHPALVTKGHGAKRDLDIARRGLAHALDEKRPLWGAALATDRNQFAGLAKRLRGQGRSAGARRQLAYHADQTLKSGAEALYLNVHDLTARTEIAEAFADLSAVLVCEAVWRDIRAARLLGVAGWIGGDRSQAGAPSTIADRCASVRAISSSLVDGFARSSSMRAAELRCAFRGVGAQHEDSDEALFIALSLCGEAAEAGGDAALASAAYGFAATHGAGSLGALKRAGDAALAQRLDGLWKLSLRLGRLALHAAENPTMSRRHYATCVAMIERSIDLGKKNEAAQANLPVALLGLGAASAQCDERDDAVAVLANAVRLAENYARAHPGETLAHVRLMEAYAARDGVSADADSVRRAVGIGRILAKARRLPAEAEALLDKLEARQRDLDAAASAISNLVATAPAEPASADRTTLVPAAPAAATVGEATEAASIATLAPVSVAPQQVSEASPKPTEARLPTTPTQKPKVVIKALATRTSSPSGDAILAGKTAISLPNAVAPSPSMEIAARDQKPLTDKAVSLLRLDDGGRKGRAFAVADAVTTMPAASANEDAQNAQAALRARILKR